MGVGATSKGATCCVVGASGAWAAGAARSAVAEGAACKGAMCCVLGAASGAAGARTWERRARILPSSGKRMPTTHARCVQKNGPTPCGVGP